MGTAQRSERTDAKPNVLLVTMDQLRADAVFDPAISTPTLDALRNEGVSFLRHYAQAAPCSPARAALYTGTYQMNNRVVANGTPLDARFDNVALFARRNGYDPVLFGYTDQSIDPRTVADPDDPRLDSYEEVLPGFRPVCHLPSIDSSPWLSWLRHHGFDPGTTTNAALTSEPDRPADYSVSAFLSEQFLAWLNEQHGPWFAHLSFLRPHPPYGAAGEFARAYDPNNTGSWITPTTKPHPLHGAALSLPGVAAPSDPAEIGMMRAQYFGMISEVDHQFGRIIAELKRSNQLEHTIVILTADHGEQLGDHGLKEKLGFFPQSYHIPLIVHDPFHQNGHGEQIHALTESVDVFATIADLLELPAPAQIDGISLKAFLQGTTPHGWRTAAHYEWDWRYLFLDGPSTIVHRGLSNHNLAVHLTNEMAYVHFGDNSSLCFDLLADPTWRTLVVDPAKILEAAEGMLLWRQQSLERTMTDMLIGKERTGRWPSPTASAVT